MFVGLCSIGDSAHNVASRSAGKTRPVLFTGCAERLQLVSDTAKTTSIVFINFNRVGIASLMLVKAFIELTNIVWISNEDVQTTELTINLHIPA